MIYRKLNDCLRKQTDCELEYLLQDQVSQMRYDMNIIIAIENEIKRRKMIEDRNKKLEELGL